MKVTNFMMLNIDDLYKIIYDKEQDDNYNKKLFGSNFYQLLNQVELNFHVENISEFEYIFLKMLYPNSITEFKMKTSLSEWKSFSEEVYHELPSTVTSSFITLLEEVDEVSEKSGNEKIFDISSPAGFIPGECIVSITGEDLCTILTFDPKIFFLENAQKCIDKEKGGLREEYVYEIYNDEELQNNIIGAFIQSIYSFIQRKMSTIDLPSDAFKMRYLNQVRGLDQPELISIRNPYFLINWHDDNVVDVREKIDDFTKKAKELHLKKSDIMKESRFVFALETEFITFFHLFNLLPLKMFTSIEDFKISLMNGLNNENAPKVPEYLSSYEKRYTNRIVSLVNWINDTYGVDPKFIMKKYEMLMNYSKIHYSISFSLNDFNEFYRNFKFLIFINDNIYGVKKVKKNVDFIYNLLLQLYSILTNGIIE